jgi:antitoxin CptB
MRTAEVAGDGWLLWRCRRGMRELDVLLERYAQVLKGPAAASERRAFARLLDLADTELAAYLLGHATPPDPELAGLVRRIAAGAALRG